MLGALNAYAVEQAVERATEEDIAGLRAAAERAAKIVAMRECRNFAVPDTYLPEVAMIDGEESLNSLDQPSEFSGSLQLGDLVAHFAT